MAFYNVAYCMESWIMESMVISMENGINDDIEVMKQHLNIFRNSLGWTAEELGNKMGITKQAISNLEQSPQKIALTQYVMLRIIFDYEFSVTKNSIFYTVYYSVWDGNRVIKDKDLFLKRLSQLSARYASFTQKAVLLPDIQKDYFVESPNRISLNRICNFFTDNTNSWLLCWLRGGSFLDNESGYETESMYSLENLLKEKWIHIYNGTECLLEGYDISWHRPLQNSSVQFALFSDNANKVANTFKPDVPIDYQKYDIILVDKEYAKGMNENKESLPKDYLDRLYIINQESDNSDIMKSMSFQKVFDAKTPGEYMNDILTRSNPSVYSIQNLLDTFYFLKPTLINRYQMMSLRNMLPAYIEERKKSQLLDMI